MIHFKDRVDAGKQLAAHLALYKNDSNVVVLGLPRGGVVTAFEIAKALNVPLDIVVPRKIGAPFNPELAVGSLTEDGTVLLNEHLMESLGLTRDDLGSIIDKEKKEAERRLKLYRGDRSPLNLEGKTVIVVDDGVATGATMQAAIASIVLHGAAKIIIAIPVAPASVIAQFKKGANEIICLDKPEHFWGISSFYDHFDQVEDETVIALLQKS